MDTGVISVKRSVVHNIRRIETARHSARTSKQGYQLSPEYGQTPSSRRVVMLEIVIAFAIVRRQAFIHA